MHHILVFVWSFSAVLCFTSFSHCDDAFSTLKGHTREVTWVEFSPDGKVVASGSKDGTVRFWDVKTGKTVETIDDSPNHVDRLAYCSDGKGLVTSETLTKRENFAYAIKIWDLKNQKVVSCIDAPHGGAFAVSPNGKLLATCSDKLASNDVVLWNTKDGKKLKTIGQIDKSVSTLAFTADNASLAIGGEAGWISVWDVDKAKESSSFVAYKDDGVVAVAFSADGASLATAAYGKPVSVHNVKDGEVSRTLQATYSCYGNLMYSPDGKLLIVPVFRVLGVFDADFGKKRSMLYGHDAGIACVAVSPDGKWIATAGGSDETVRLWEMPKSTK
jgi:WD40 repeat protein